MKILFAVNLTEPVDAVHKVEHLCDRLDAELYVIHVDVPAEADLSLHDSEGYDASLFQYEADNTNAAEEFGLLRKVAFDHFIKTHFTRPVEAMLQESTDPASTIINGVERLGADILVLTQKPHPFLERLVVGSLSAKVLKLVNVPTLLIPIRE